MKSEGIFRGRGCGATLLLASRPAPRRRGAKKKNYPMWYLGVGVDKRQHQLDKQIRRSEGELSGNLGVPATGVSLY